VRPTKRQLTVLVAGLALLVLPGCGGRQSAQRDAGRPVTVTERDFRISVDGRSGTQQLKSGDLRLAVSNRGPDTHELLVVRTNGSRLPLRADGLTVDEDAVKSATVATLDGHQAGTAERLKVHLAPGRYVLFCNMAGHYLGGMHAQLVVS
jgi:uncharacterized cupredoxin-like copper-binding protein